MDTILKDNGLKNTRQRRLVLDLIIKLDNEATLYNIIDASRKKVDVSTIYRIIDLFLINGILNKSVNYSGKIYYSLKEAHSHYFFCIKCHRKEILDGCPVALIDEALEKNKGYKILDHTFILKGICAKCQKKLAINIDNC